MNCSSCGTQLPPGARACPNCGALTPAYYSDLGPSSYSAPSGPSPSPGPPFAAPPYGAPSPIPPTEYGSNPYGTPPSTPYNTPITDPYGATAPSAYRTPAPSPYTPLPVPPPPRRKTRLGIIIGVGLLVLILIGAGIFAFARTKSTSVTPAPRVPTPTPAPATATAVALQNIYTQATGGAPAISDSLQGPDNFGWDRISDANVSCGFTGGTYHSSAKSGYFSPCYAQATNFSNLALQAQITILSGHSGGILFRNNNNSFAGYQFRISTDGTYILNKNVPSNGSNNFTTLASGRSPAIKTGTNQPNLIAVVARGNTIYLYVNKQYVDGTTDSSFTSGQVGVYVDSDANSVEAAFSNLQVWKL